MDTQIAMMPVQWADLKDIDDVEPVGSADEACLKDLHAVLRQHGKFDRFGISLVHKHFDMDPEEVLVETTDKHNRTLTLRPMDRRSAEARNTVETSWILSEGTDRTATSQCYVRCVRNIHGNHENGGHYWA